MLYCTVHIITIAIGGHRYFQVTITKLRYFGKHFFNCLIVTITEASGACYSCFELFGK
jgi:hypothetical protein